MSSAASRDRQTAEPERLDRRQWVTLMVLTVSTFVVLLDASAVNIALPVIVRGVAAALCVGREQATPGPPVSSSAARQR